MTLKVTFLIGLGSIILLQALSLPVEHPNQGEWSEEEMRFQVNDIDVEIEAETREDNLIVEQKFSGREMSTDSFQESEQSQESSGEGEIPDETLNYRKQYILSLYHDGIKAVRRFLLMSNNQGQNPNSDHKIMRFG